MRLVMKIGTHAEALELNMQLMGNQSIIHPSLIWNDQGATLIDTGVPEQYEEIKAAIEKAGKSITDVNRIVLTHQDVDHIGSLTELLEKSNHIIEVYAHADDIPYIEGDKPLIKMNPERLETMLASLPEDVANQMKAQFANLQTNKVDHELKDGESLPFDSNVSVIATPGHTPGHISLYVKEDKLLIAGDAMVVDEASVLQGPREGATPDMEQALASVRKFLDYDIEKVLCYHGGLYTGDVHKRIKEILEG